MSTMYLSIPIFAVCCAFLGTTIGEQPQHIPIKKAPYKVVIVLGKNHSQVIGTGAILTEHWAITTATCIKEHRGKPSSIMVRSGSGIYNSNGGLHYVKHIVVHPEFGKQGSSNLIGQGDVALLRLVFTFHMSLTVAPIPLPPHVTPAGTLANLITWPLRDGKRVATLNTLTVNIIDWVECRKAYEQSGIHLGETTLCTSSVDEPQEGDALVTSGALTGLYSESRSKSLPRHYIDVSSYVPWIKEKLDKEEKRFLAG